MRCAPGLCAIHPFPVDEGQFGWCRHFLEHCRRDQVPWRLTKLTPSPWLFTVPAVIAGVLLTIKIVKFRRRAKRLIQAREGERAVAQHLDSEFRRDG